MFACFVIIALASCQVHSIYVVVGPSGVGKSTLINYLANNTVVKINNGVKSDTKDTLTYSFYSPLLKQNSTFIDTQGFIDTEDPQEKIVNILKNLMTKELWADPSKEYKFLVLFSATDSRIQLERTFSGLENAFGINFFKSVVIVLTKIVVANKLGTDYIFLTREAIGKQIKNYMTNRKIDNELNESSFPVVEIEAMRLNEISESQQETQISELISATNRVQPFVSSFIESTYEDILKDIHNCMNSKLFYNESGGVLNMLLMSAFCNDKNVINGNAMDAIETKIASIYNLKSTISELEGKLTPSEFEDYKRFLKSNPSVYQMLSKLSKIFYNREKHAEKMGGKYDFIMENSSYFAFLFPKLTILYKFFEFTHTYWTRNCDAHYQRAKEECIMEVSNHMGKAN